MQKLFFLTVILFIHITFVAQSYTQTMRRLPDTGENTSYTGTFGEDNDYSINTPLFKILPNGTVIDSITGLMWQISDGGEMTFSTALIYCSTLTLGGYNNWRLPNAHEAFSILNHQYANPSLDASVFTTSAADYWWTFDRQTNDTTKVWVTNAGGGIGNHPKTETTSAGGPKRFHARAVRSIYTPTILTSRYTNNNVTVYDNATKLTWQKTAFKDSLTWEDALHYADTVTTGGFTDWRLPNIKEIQSINDETLISPSVNTNYFTNIGVKKYWSSTTLPNQTLKAWYLDTQYGITTYQFKTYKLNLLLVRGDGSTLTGINECESTENGNVYPNPFKLFIKIKNPNSEDFYVLTNANGQIIYSGKSIETQDFSKLATGIYFLKITGKQTRTTQLVKE